MIRIFVAYPIGKNLANSFLKLSSKNSSIKNIRWTPEENLHITLFFIGEIEESNLDSIKIILKSTLEKIKTFSLEFEDVVVKGKRSRAMIWGLFKKTKCFSELNELIYHAVKPFMTISPVHEDPLPHCTVARIKEESGNIDLALEIKKEIVVQVDHAELWKTIHTKVGVSYERLDKYFFK